MPTTGDEPPSVFDRLMNGPVRPADEQGAPDRICAILIFVPSCTEADVREMLDRAGIMAALDGERGLQLHRFTPDHGSPVLYLR